MPVQPEHEPAEGSSASWAGRHPGAGQALEDLGRGWALFTRQGWNRQRVAATVAAILINFLALLVTINLIPGLSASAEWDVALAVVLAAVLTAALRPLLQALALAFGWVGVLVTGLFARAAILYVAFVVTPDIHVDGFWPAFAASWLVAVITIAISWLLSAGDETEFLSQLLMFSRPRRVPRQDEPGVVMIQIDGLAAPLLQWAVVSGNLPTLSRWIRAGSHRLTPWHAQVPPTTPASQAGLLHGNNRGVPAFRWFEKDAGRLVVASSPRDAALIESRMSDGRGLLADGGVSISNIFSGDAPMSHLTLSSLALGRPARSYAAFFISPYGFTRSFMLTVGEALKEIYQARRQRLRGIEPRIRRSSVFAAQRAISNVLLRDLNTVLVAQHMMRGAKSIFCDYTDYDEIAHHAGPTRAESLRALEGVDRVIGTLSALAAHAPRPYEFVILSDHGQSQGATFLQRYGTPLEEVVRGLMASAGGATPDSLAATGTEEARTPVSRFLAELRQRHGVVGKLSRSKLASVVEEEPATGHDRGGRDIRAAAVGTPATPGERAAAMGTPVDGTPHTAGHPDVARPEVPPPGNARPGNARAGNARAGNARPDNARPGVPELVVAAGGNLALVYFPRHPGRLTAEEIEAAYPGLLAGIANHPGVGFVCTRTSSDGPVALGRDGVHHLVSGFVTGEDPLAAFGDGAVADLLTHEGCDHVGDLVVNSRLDSGTNEVAAFEELVGCHGGLGGWQGQAVLVHPVGWLVDEDLVGAESVHRQLVRWLERVGHRSDLKAHPPAGALV
ncbi:MAG: alkaline phosphatase family protein [Frankiaceae bacterium]